MRRPAVARRLRDVTRVRAPRAGEYNLQFSALQDAHAVRAWATAYHARRQSVNIDLSWGRGLICLQALPSLLHEELATDVAACSCHGTPLDGSRRDGALVTEPGPARPARAGAAPAQRCPISHLDLDRRDIQQVGFVSHFSWPRSLAANAAEIEAEVVVPADEGDATQPPHLTLAVVSRVRLHDLSFATLFGYPWEVSSVAEAIEDTGGTLRALAMRLHEAGEALLCRALSWRHFQPAHRLPSNMAALLHRHFVLLPQGAPHASLLLKCVGSAAQIVPPIAPLAAEHHDLSAVDRARAAQILCAPPARRVAYLPPQRPKCQDVRLLRLALACAQLGRRATRVLQPDPPLPGKRWELHARALPLVAPGRLGLRHAA